MITLKGKSSVRRTIIAYSLYCLLLLLSLILLSAVTSCQHNELPQANACGTFATIRDLRGLDGCGIVLELDNGEKLEPLYNASWCGTPPLPPPTIENIALMDGKRVSISYKELTDRVSICMVGKVVEITCISEVRTGEN